MSQHLSERAAVNELITDINNDLWKLNIALQHLIIKSDDNINDSMLLTIDGIKTKTTSLLNINLILSNQTLRKNIQNLNLDFVSLKTKLKHLKQLRSDPFKVFPAMPLLVYQLNPISKQIYTTATLAMHESNDSLHKNTQKIIYHLFSDFRSTWLQKNNSFRMYTTSQNTIFNVSIDSGISNTNSVIEGYDIKITKYLNLLNNLNKKDKLTLQQATALKKLNVYTKNWNKSYDKIKKIYSSNEYLRLDTRILKNEVYPLFNAIWKTLNTTKKNLEQLTTSDIKSTTATADTVISSIWYFSLFIIILGLLGTLTFEFQIRRPIKSVSNALKAEANGIKNVKLPDYNLCEMKDLVSAFGNMRSEVSARQERLQSILNNTAEGIITFDENGIIETWNVAAAELFGWTEQEVIGTLLSNYISSSEFDNREQYLNSFLRNEIINLETMENDIIGHKKNGDTFQLSFKSSLMLLNSEKKYTALIANITQQKALLENLRYLAEHDELTGLNNRTYFNDELTKTVDKAKRNSKYNCSVLYIDLDNFKYVNDTLGHAAGDKILVDITKVLKQRTRKSDLLARLGGDEFVVLVCEDNLKVVAGIAENFREQIANYSLHYDGKIIDIGCSIGVAIINKKTKSTSEVMSQADVACHFAKRAGRNRVHIFSDNDSNDVKTMSSDMGWSRRIKLAIENNSFVLALQPIVNTNNQILESYEVLIRMRDEQDAIIMPFAFLPTAERFGLAVDIDTWVIKHAIRYLSKVRNSYPDVRFSINLSAQSLTVPEIPKLIPDLLKTYNLNADALTFEVTETSAIADMSIAVELLSSLQKLGCKTSLDDFGSGMSSFAYLRELPVDIVKIDGSFVQNMTNSAVDQAILKAMNEIAHSLGKQTVAEFVEHEQHLKLLQNFGVDYAQGYYIDKPKLIYDVFPILNNNVMPFKKHN